MTTQNFAASMLLTKKGEPRENARKNYEMCKKELEGMGLKECGSWIEGEEIIFINAQGWPDKSFGSRHECKYLKTTHGPLLQYKPALLFAIAGQRPEEIGSIYVAPSEFNGGLFKITGKEEPGIYQIEWLNYVSGLNGVSGKFLYNKCHLATIPELIAAFPCEEGVYQNPEQVRFESLLKAGNEAAEKCEEAYDALKQARAKHDPVNKPAHYTDGKIEVIDFIEDKKLGYHLGNAIKYIARAGKKDPAKTVEDLQKAVWYIKRKIHDLSA